LPWEKAGCGFGERVMSSSSGAVKTRLSVFASPVVQQRGGAGLAGEPVHGVPAQPQDLGGFPLEAPGLQQIVDGGVPLAGACSDSRRSNARVLAA
jgi:hypothetical protein